MCKRKGDPLSGNEFFKQLYADDHFCKQLGRTMLSVGRLESELIRYIQANNPELNTNKANLGRLIGIAEKNMLLEKMLPALKDINVQRNYLAHNIHALFSGLIEETILPSKELLDSDVDVFTGRAVELAENLNDLSDIVAKYNENT
jgi:nucleosome binding factor SPN SPT16 subunit